MDMIAGETETVDLRVGFDCRLKLEFHRSRVTSDAGLLAFHELDDALVLTEMAGQVLGDIRTGKNGRHTLTAQFRQSHRFQHSLKADTLNLVRRFWR